MDTPNYPDPLCNLGKLPIQILIIDTLSIRTILDLFFYPHDYFDCTDSNGDYPNYYTDYFDPPGNSPDPPGNFPDHPGVHPDYLDAYLSDCPKILVTILTILVTLLTFLVTILPVQTTKIGLVLIWNVALLKRD